MNNTSTRTTESLKQIIDTIISSSSEFPSMYNESIDSNTLMLDFSQKMNTSITLEYMAGLIDGGGSFEFNFSTTSSRITSFFFSSNSF